MYTNIHTTIQKFGSVRVFIYLFFLKKQLLLFSKDTMISDNKDTNKHFIKPEVILKLQ